MPAFPDLSAPLTGTAAALRLAAERDIPEVLIAHQDDPELYLRLGLVRPPSGAELGRRVEAGPADRATGTAIWLTIVAPGGDECWGQIGVHEVDWDHLRAELGIWVVPRHRGAGLAAEALALCGRWLLDACGLKRLQLLTEPDNAPMRRAAQKAAFREEGTLRGYLRGRGQRVDMVMLSLITADLAEAA
jgi:RimJ/RimL family protein N-acetyltransferase